MKFTHAEPDENFRILRLVSEGGRWEAGLVPMLFGVRVRVGVVGASAVVIDYCAGADQAFQFDLLATILIILDGLPESTGEVEILRMMPTYKVRPINKDSCWLKLLEMAKAAHSSQPVT